MSGYPFHSGLAQSDMAYVATVGIAKQSPQLFTRDYFLNDPANYSYYPPLNVALVRWGARLVGDYLQPYYTFGFVVTFVQLIGFFLLGKVLFNRTGSGVLLAFASLGVCGISGLGSWQPSGLLARGLFNALLPYLLAAAWQWRRRPWTWPLVLAGCGVLVYVHPVSAPAWAPALLLSYLSVGFGNWTTKLKWLLLSGAVFAFLALGFSTAYLMGKHLSATLSPPELAQYHEALTLRHASSALWASRTALGILTGAPERSPSKLLRLGKRWVLTNALRRGALPLLLLACMAFIVGMWKNETREAALWAGLLATGVVVGSLLIPGVVQWIERETGRVLSVYELLRGLGYLFPLTFLLGFVASVALAKWVSDRFAIPSLFLQLAVGFQGAFLVLWLFWFPLEMISNWNQREPGEELRKGRDLEDVLTYIRRETPTGSVLIGYQGSRYLPWPPEDTGMFIRLYGERPVAFCWKDGAFLSARNPRAFLSWAEKYRAARRVLPRPWRQENDVPQFCTLSRSWGAEFWLTTNQVLQGAEQGFDHSQFVRYRNDSYALVDLVACEQASLKASTALLSMPVSNE